jgi:hypothetical protein
MMRFQEVFNPKNGLCILMTQMNVSEKAHIAGGFDSSYCCYASMIGGIIVMTLFLEAWILLWKSAKRARAHDMRMLSDAIILELVMKNDFFLML